VRGHVTFYLSSVFSLSFFLSVFLLFVIIPLVPYCSLLFYYCFLSLFFLSVLSLLFLPSVIIPLVPYCSLLFFVLSLCHYPFSSVLFPLVLYSCSLSILFYCCGYSPTTVLSLCYYCLILLFFSSFSDYFHASFMPLSRLLSYP